MGPCMALSFFVFFSLGFRKIWDLGKIWGDLGSQEAFVQMTSRMLPTDRKSTASLLSQAE